jgi:hypothetical protein
MPSASANPQRSKLAQTLLQSLMRGGAQGAMANPSPFDNEKSMFARPQAPAPAPAPARAGKPKAAAGPNNIPIPIPRPGGGGNVATSPSSLIQSPPGSTATSPSSLLQSPGTPYQNTMPNAESLPANSIRAPINPYQNVMPNAESLPPARSFNATPGIKGPWMSNPNQQAGGTGIGAPMPPGGASGLAEFWRRLTGGMGPTPGAGGFNGPGWSLQPDGTYRKGPGAGG